MDIIFINTYMVCSKLRFVMFKRCPLKRNNGKCSFATDVYCGLATGENRISKLKKCPKIKGTKT